MKEAGDVDEVIAILLLIIGDLGHSWINQASVTKPCRENVVLGQSGYLRVTKCPLISVRLSQAQSMALTNSKRNNLLSVDLTLW